MHPEYPNLKPLGPPDYASLAPYLALARRPICDLSFANLCIWTDCEAASFTFINQNLCILIEPHKKLRYFLEPLGGNLLPETVKLCLDHAGRISRATESLLDNLPPDILHLEPERDHFDYVYEVKTLAELKGKKHDGKRNQIRKFVRNHPDYQFLPLEPGHLGQALALFEKWSEERGEDTAPDETASPSYTSVACQQHALKRAFSSYGQLGLRGGGVFVAGEMQGFIIGSEINATTAVVHFLYANSSMRGIYQLLLQDSCRTLFSAYEHINLEEDLGIPGLRKTKLSYDPLYLEKKYLITPR